MIDYSQARLDDLANRLQTLQTRHQGVFPLFEKQEWGALMNQLAMVETQARMASFAVRTIMGSQTQKDQTP